MVAVAAVFVGVVAVRDLLLPSPSCGLRTPPICQSAKASPLNSDRAKGLVQAELSKILDKDFIREHAKMVRWTPRARL